MIRIVKYTSQDKKIWNDFISSSKNGTFMLNRNFMDYHADRFHDFSLMFYKKETLIALLPASLHGTELRSHGGLTYGGLISNKDLRAVDALEIFDVLKTFLKENNISELLYKRVPSLYYTYPSDEDIYALFRNNAMLYRRDISTVIDLKERIPFNTRRKRNLKKAEKAGLEFKESTDFETYISLLSDILKEKHNASPVHSAQELHLLKERFPKNIKLYASFKKGKMMAGVLMFSTPKVAHAQYIMNSFDGRTIGALDFVFDKLINEVYTDKDYFDFGISTEEEGRFLNEGLIEQKQEFGGRALLYDSYKLEIK